MYNDNKYLYDAEKIVDNKALLVVKKNELESLLTESKIQLNSILLYKNQVKAECDINQSYINFNNLQYLIEKYNEKELEVNKISEAIDFLSNKIRLIETNNLNNSNMNNNFEYEIADIKLYNQLDSNINYELNSIDFPSVGVILESESESIHNNITDDELNIKIDELEAKINETIFDIEVYKQNILNNSKEEIYESFYLAIKNLITLEILLEKYLNESKTNQKLIKLKENLKYSSARFISYKEIDSSLYSRVLGLCLKIEYSLDSKEVVNSYLEREKIYNKNYKKGYILPKEYLEKLEKSNDVIEKKSDIINNDDSKKIELEIIIRNLKTLGIEVTDNEIKEIKDLID